MGTCLECECATTSHWLCSRHMHERARARLPPETTPIREAELMRALVFDFPVACGCEEFAARVRYVSDVWCSTSKVRDIERKHGVSVSVSGAVTRLEMQGLVCAFVEFICRNTHVVRGIAAACADRVLCWYPALVCTESVESVRRGERMLHALERASGTRDFLVLADLLMAFASVLTRDAIELVYVSYARRLALFEGMRLTWSA